MKITMGELFNGKDVLEKLVGLDINVQAAFKLNRMVRAINEELVLFEEQRQKLINKYGENQEDGSVMVTPENQEEFHKELIDLFNVEINLQFDPISVKGLGDVKISAAELMMIDKLLTE